jgi:hypothetical protein
MDSSKQDENAKPEVPLEPATGELRFGIRSVTLATLLLLAVAGAATLVWTGRIRLPTFAAPAYDRHRALKELAERNLDFQKDLNEARRDVKWQMVRGLLDQVEQLMNKLEVANAQIENEFKQLEDTGSDDGSRLRRSETLIDQYIALRESRRVTPEEIRAYRELVEKYRALCNEAIEDRTVVFDADAQFRDELDDVLEKSVQALKNVNADREALHHIITACKQFDVTINTLPEAIEQRKKNRAGARLEKMAKDLEAENAKADEAARKTQLAVEREFLAAEQKLQAAEAKVTTERALGIVRQAQMQLGIETDRQAHVARFGREFPKVKSLLSPFISHGRMHLAKDQTWSKGEPAPLSLAAMKANPYFNRQPAGAEWGLDLASERAANDRPRGSFPTAIFGNYEVFARVHAFIIEFGDLMVERKLLLP